MTTISPKGTMWWVICSLLSLALNSHAADVYRWTDERSNVFFSDQPQHPQAQAIKITPQSNRYLFSVRRVNDGDTLTLTNDERVRFLGINAPEISSRFGEAEPLGEAARDWLVAQLEQGQVYLEFDQEARDHYDRQLAYVWLPSGEFINEQLLQKGWAALTLMPPNLKYADRLIAAQQQAIDNSVGIWAEKAYQPISVNSLNQNDYRGWRRWQMTPTAISETRNFYVLNVNKQISLRISKQEHALFPPIEDYLHRELEVRGWMSKRGDHFSVRVRHPSAIVMQ